jgi:hypothetical protein
MAGHIDSRYRSGNHWRRRQITCSARVADSFGTSQSFLIYPAFMLALCGLLALINRRLQRPVTATPDG